MKSWLDLTNEEQKSFKIEFKNKKKIIDLRILFYTLFIIFMFPVLVSIVGNSVNGCYENTCNNNILFFGLISFIFLALSIINSILVDKNNKEFAKWLKTKNIEK